MSLDLWTIGLQAANVLILLWLLRRFLYRPLQQVLEQRRKSSAELIEQARQGQAEVAAGRAELARQRAEIATLHDQALAEAQTTVATERARLLGAAEGEAVERAKAAAAALEAERVTARTALADEAAALALDIARRLLQHQPEAIVLAPFLREACAEVGRLAPAARPASGEEVEVVTARIPGEAEQARCREELQAALGCVPRLRFSTDPALLAGVELRLPHAVIRSHWSQDLASIRDALHTHAHAA